MEWRERWVTPEGGEVRPGAAVPVAETAGRDLEFWTVLYELILKSTEKCAGCSERLRHSLREFSERRRAAWLRDVTEKPDDAAG